jgi:hypothetical protein
MVMNGYYSGAVSAIWNMSEGIGPLPDNEEEANGGAWQPPIPPEED